MLTDVAVGALENAARSRFREIPRQVLRPAVDNIVSMVDVAKLQPVADCIIDSAFSQGITSSSARDRVFFMLWSYSAAVDNGGFASFFYNSFADHFADTLDALQEVALADHAELLERAACILFSSEVPRTTAARNAAMDQLPENVGTDEEFDRLYDAYTARGGGERILQALQTWYFASSDDLPPANA